MRFNLLVGPIMHIRINGRGERCELLGGEAHTILLFNTSVLIVSRQKYGHVAFDSSQKAVLTSCVLRYKPNLNSTAPNPNSNSAATNGSSNGIGNGMKKEEEIGRSEEGLVNCCFSFTIRRDKWGIPSMIVGNFIKC